MSGSLDRFDELAFARHPPSLMGVQLLALWRRVIHEPRLRPRRVGQPRPVLFLSLLPKDVGSRTLEAHVDGARRVGALRGGDEPDHQNNERYDHETSKQPHPVW